MKKYDPIPIEEIRKAQERIKGTAIKTPLLKLNVEDIPAEIYLKLETLQPIGSFKIRGATNAIKKAKPSELKNGVWTMSAGNHGQGVAYVARKHGLKCIINTPHYAAKTKIDALKRMGAEIKTRQAGNLEELKAFFEPETYPDMKGLLVHPFSDPDVMAGQGTIGLEIVEELPDVDAVLTPWGGGGLSCGVASAIRAIKPDVKLYACEPETGNALASSFKAALHLDPLNSQFLKQYGIFLSRTKSQDKAETAFLLSTLYTPTRPEFSFQYGSWLLSNAKKNQGIAQMKKSLELDEKYADKVLTAMILAVFCAVLWFRGFHRERPDIHGHLTVTRIDDGNFTYIVDLGELTELLNGIGAGGSATFVVVEDTK